MWKSPELFFQKVVEEATTTMTKDASREDIGQLFRKEGWDFVQMGVRKRFRR
jgi:hypothetical protein